MQNRSVVMRIVSVLALASLLVGAPVAIAASAENTEAANQEVTVSELDVFSYLNVNGLFSLADVGREGCRKASSPVLQAGESQSVQFLGGTCEDECDDERVACRDLCLQTSEDPFELWLCIDDCEEDWEFCLEMCP